ncbi:MAG: hypothetical protein E7347_06525 [Clostridiales bacterium]|nr:hypothetical protein [Clostridiales bacterium]
MINYLEKVSDKEKTYNLSIKDCFGINVAINDEIQSCFKRNYIRVLSRSGVKQHYYVNNSFYYYVKDGNLYKSLKSGDVLIENIGSFTPAVCQVRMGGEIKTLFVGEKSFFEDGKRVDLPPAQIAKVHNGGLYTAFDNVITLPSKFNFELNQTSLDVVGTIGINSNSGKILSLISKKDCLLIICERAIYTLKTIGEVYEYQLEKLSLPVIDVIGQSIVEIRDKVYMVSGGKLMQFCDGKLQVISNSHLNDLKFEVLSFGAENKGVYSLPISIDGKKALYFYDALDKSQCFFSFYGIPTTDGNILALNNALYVIKKEKSNENKTLISKKMNFSSNNFKALKSISFDSLTSGECVIEGDFGSKVYNFKKGNNKFNFNLFSKWFIFQFSSKEQDFLIKNITIKYNVKGE